MKNWIVTSTSLIRKNDSSTCSAVRWLRQSRSVPATARKLANVASAFPFTPSGARRRPRSPATPGTARMANITADMMKTLESRSIWPAGGSPRVISKATAIAAIPPHSPSAHPMPETLPRCGAGAMSIT